MALPLLPRELEAVDVAPSFSIPLMSPPLSCPSDLLPCYARVLNLLNCCTILVWCVALGLLLALVALVAPHTLLSGS